MARSITIQLGDSTHGGEWEVEGDLLQVRSPDGSRSERVARWPAPLAVVDEVLGFREKRLIGAAERLLFEIARGAGRL